MEYLIELIEKRKEIGKRQAYCRGGNLNDKVEYERLGSLILDEVNRLYENGKLNDFRL